MKLAGIFICFLLSFQFSFAQDGLELELEQAYVSEEYDKIITLYSKDTDNFSSRSLYFVGMAYYMKQDDPNCLIFMNLSLEKDSSNADAHFMKGVTLNYMGKFDKAIPSIKNAIAIDSTNTDYYNGLGDAYFQLKDYNNALTSYSKSIEQKDATERGFTMIPQVYAALNKPEEALQAFYQSKNNIPKQSPSYIIALYNIGLYEFLKMEYDKSETALVELLELAPNDHHSISKLIQVYYGKKEYDKAIPLRDKLYAAQKKGLLDDQGYLADMFCFDQFRWKDQLVQVFERYEEGDGKLYYKHLFYLLNENNEIVYKIQTENSPISIELDGPKYVLGTDHEGTHYNWGIGIEKDFDYENLKKAVIAILDKKIKPSASTSKKY